MYIYTYICMYILFTNIIKTFWSRDNSCIQGIKIFGTIISVLMYNFLGQNVLIYIYIYMYIYICIYIYMYVYIYIYIQIYIYIYYSQKELINFGLRVHVFLYKYDVYKHIQAQVW